MVLGGADKRHGKQGTCRMKSDIKLVPCKRKRSCIRSPPAEKNLFARRAPRPHPLLPPLATLRAGHVDLSAATLCTYAEDGAAKEVAVSVAAEVNSRLFEPQWSVSAGAATPTSSLSASCASPSSLLSAPILIVVGVVPSLARHLDLHDSLIRPGSFSLRFRTGVLVLQAVDAAGLRAGAGRLLRELRMPPRLQVTQQRQSHQQNLHQPPQQQQPQQHDSVSIPAEISVSHDGTSVRWNIRGHQIPADHHPMQFRTQQQFSRFAKDLAVFGTNFLEVSHV